MSNGFYRTRNQLNGGFDNFGFQDHPSDLYSRSSLPDSSVARSGPNYRDGLGSDRQVSKGPLSSRLNNLRSSTSSQIYGMKERMGLTPESRFVPTATGGQLGARDLHMPYQSPWRDNSHYNASAKPNNVGLSKSLEMNHFGDPTPPPREKINWRKESVDRQNMALSKQLKSKNALHSLQGSTAAMSGMTGAEMLQRFIHGQISSFFTNKINRNVKQKNESMNDFSTRSMSRVSEIGSSPGWHSSQLASIAKGVYDAQTANNNRLFEEDLSKDRIDAENWFSRGIQHALLPAIGIPTGDPNFMSHLSREKRFDFDLNSIDPHMNIAYNSGGRFNPQQGITPYSGFS